MNNVHRYQALIETVQEGSLTKAARKLGYTQSGITHLLSGLEAKIGLELVSRTKKGARLTEDGTRLLPYFQAVLQAEENLHEQIERIKGLETGTIRLGSFSSVSTTFLPKLVKQFQEMHPHINFEVLHGNYTQIETYLDAGLVDIGFLRGPLKPAFEGELFYRDQVLALLPANHPAASHASFALSGFEAEPFIMMEADTDNDYEHYLAENGLDPSIIYSAPEDSAVMALIEQGLGIGLGYELSLKRSSFDIVGVELEVPFPRDIYWSTKKGVRPTWASSAFIAFLKNVDATKLL